MVAGYTGYKADSYDWVKRYFGSDATWNRYDYTASSTPASYTPGATTGGTIFADVIDSTKISPFNAYGIEACYAFHGYSYSGQKAVNLGAGVVGYSLAYRGTDGTAYSVLYWIWAVDDAQGNKHYERVVLLKPSSDNAAAASAPQSDPLKGVGYNSQGSSSVVASPADQAQLTSFASTVIAHQPAAKKKLGSA